MPLCKTLRGFCQTKWPNQALYNYFFTPVGMTDFVSIYSFTAGEVMSERRGPGKGSFVIHQTVFYLQQHLFDSILFSTQQGRSRETEKWQHMSWDVDFPLISEVPLSSSCPGDIDITTSGDAADLSMI